MKNVFLRKLASLSIEEKILNTGVLLTLSSMFMPWFSGRWIGSELRTYNGFGFYTSFIGLAIFAINAYVLMVTVTPLTSSTQLLQKDRKDIVRLYCTVASTALLLATLSVLIKVTFEYQAMEVRFGIGSALLGSLASMFYSFIKVQSGQRQEVLSFFHQQESSQDDHEEAVEQIIDEAKQELVSKTAEQPEPELVSTPQAVHPSPPPPPPPESHSSRYL